jgi:hypothetical protein
MTTQKFIEKVNEGGYVDSQNRRIWGIEDGNIVLMYEDGHRAASVSFSEILLDPLAWQAVGKVEGWLKTLGNATTFYPLIDRPMDEWEFKWHRLLVALAEGKTIEQYLETL